MKGSDRLRAFVVQNKLVELLAARDRLSSAYDAIEAEARDLDDAAAVEALSRGLAALRIGTRLVHPEVANLEVAAGAGDPRLLARVRARLEAAIAQGRARADVMPVFGGVLGEWLAPVRRRPEPALERAALVEPLLKPASATAAALIARLEGRIDSKALARARELVGASSESLDDMGAGWMPHPDDALLDEEGLADKAATGELDASGQENPLAREFHQAFDISWRGVEGWDWPEAGVTLAPIWTRNRYRLRPKLDLITASTVEEVGRAVEEALGALCGRARLNRLQRLRRLKALNAPAIIIENEARMLDKTMDLFGWLGPDEAVGQDGTIALARAESRMMSSSEGGYDYAASEIGRAAALLRAEIRVAEAHGRPVYVLKADIADFYPSVSHALVLGLLRWLGLDPRLVDLTARALSPRLPEGGRTRVGLPLGLRLSRAVESLLMAAILGEVRAAAPVEVISLVDDVVLVAHSPEHVEAAWAALRAAVGDAGLCLNEAKVGAAAFGAPLPAGLPQGPVRWGMLRLGEGGDFEVDEEALEEFIAITAARVDGHWALLDRVGAWREQLRYLWTWLAPSADLGPDHLAAALDAARRLGEAGASGQGSMRAMLRGEVERRFLGGGRAALPDAWLHWPLTAGGLGLPYPPADGVPLQLAQQARQRAQEDFAAGGGGEDRPMPAPTAHPEVDEAWGAWFARQLAPLEPAAPVETPEMEDQVRRFIKRGERLGRAAAPLSPYWRWVLHTLGPDILEAYGTFDFIATDLVPTQMIRGSF